MLDIKDINLKRSYDETGNITKNMILIPLMKYIFTIEQKMITQRTTCF